MKRFAARAASALPGASGALLAAALMASPALAGDTALLALHGYSADGRYFAFEEYGIQDGSGFPYANIYIVDLETDNWVTGTPVRVRDDSEIDTQTMADLQRVRAEALAEAAPQFENLAIETPAWIVALIGDGIGGDAATLDFAIPGFTGPGSVQGAYTLSLETFASSSPQDCETFLGDAPLGYALTLSGDGPDRELHRDGQTLPNSRGCPTAYRLHGVVIPFHNYGLESAVALVSVYPFGFEGPDRRFIAVPLGR